MNTSFLRTNLKKGFSLVEMLVVIAVIGVIAAIAVPQIGNLTASAKTARDQRNAQSIASVFAAGTAAGVAWTVTDASAAADDVVAGKAPTSGAFNGKIFRVPNITGADLTAAKTHLSLSTDSQLIYAP